MKRNNHNVMNDIHDLTHKINKTNKLYQQAKSLLQQGKHVEAHDLSNAILKENPNHSGAIQLLGIIANLRGQHQLAIDLFGRIAKASSDQYEFLVNFGRILHNGGQLEEAVGAYKRAIKLQPKLPEAYNELGLIYRGMGKYKKAISCHQMAISANPDYIDAYYNLGNLYRKQGKQDQALDSYQRAISLNPKHAESYWASVLAKIPPIMPPDYDYNSNRDTLSRELVSLNNWFEDNKIDVGHLCVGTHYPFYLAYQEMNNKLLLAQHGELCARLMQRWMENQEYEYPRAANKNIVKIGVVSAFIRNHSVWNAFVRTWLTQLDENRYEIHIFHTDGVIDGETIWARSRAASFTQGPCSLSRWVEAIIEKKCDVLIYPEIGMNAITVKLASLRLANVQVASWGHPETTGLPTIDYYLSATDFEPADAQSHYTEKLILLPHLGCCYQPLPVEETIPDLDYYNIDTESTIFICPGTPFKYLPQHDRVLVEIASRLGKCQFIFFTDNNNGQELSAHLYNRLCNAFEHAGLEINDFVTFLPWLDRSLFYGLMRKADVFLDTIGFSGFNTAAQAIECGLPIVTVDGQFMRGRLASGILRRLGMQDLIAHDDEEYIELAVKISLDKKLRERIQRNMIQNQDKLFNDTTPIMALDRFLTIATEFH